MSHVDEAPQLRAAGTQRRRGPPSTGPCEACGAEVGEGCRQHCIAHPEEGTSSTDGPQ